MFSCIVVLFLSVLTGAGAQFMLVWKTTGPTVPAIPPGVFNPNCQDAIPNCKAYGKQSCQGPYAAWAKKNCANFCSFCTGPTAPPPPCKDMVNNCDTYGKSVCSNPEYKGWVDENCRYYCRACPPSQLAIVDSHTTRMPASQCVDKVDCRLYGKSSCVGSYQHWAKENCPAYCGLCVGLPTPPQACADKLPNCSSYQKATCSDPSYAIWVEDNCRKYCGKCGGGGVPVPVKPNQGPGYPVPPQAGKR